MTLQYETKYTGCAQVRCIFACQPCICYLLPLNEFPGLQASIFEGGGFCGAKDGRSQRYALLSRTNKYLRKLHALSFSRLRRQLPPGVATWSCYVSTKKETLKERLYHEILNADGNLYKFNCAIALGLLEDTRALPALCEIVHNRDCFFFTDNRRSNQFRSAIAVCLLGRLGSKNELPLLFVLI